MQRMASIKIIQSKALFTFYNMDLEKILIGPERAKQTQNKFNCITEIVTSQLPLPFVFKLPARTYSVTIYRKS